MFVVLTVVKFFGGEHSIADKPYPVGQVERLFVSNSSRSVCSGCSSNIVIAVFI